MRFSRKAARGLLAAAFILLMGGGLAWVFGGTAAWADDFSNTQPVPPSPPPPAFDQIKSQIKIADDDSGSVEEENKKKVGVQIRDDAMKEAALSYGARAGLAWRTFQIQRRLAEQEGNLSRIYDFAHLILAAPSGMLIEPPIVSEAQKAVLVANGGQNAAVADRVYRINKNARIVTAPRNWRTYLERDWGKVDPAPNILRPKNETELKQWQNWLVTGWEEGTRQADDVFQADLDKLNTDYLGMIRYRELLAQGMITPPYATQEDRGVTGDANEMRVGDRGLAITGPSQFNTKSERWITAPR